MTKRSHRSKIDFTCPFCFLGRSKKGNEGFPTHIPLAIQRANRFQRIVLAQKFPQFHLEGHEHDLIHPACRKKLYNLSKTYKYKGCIDIQCYMCQEELKESDSIVVFECELMGHGIHEGCLPEEGSMGLIDGCGLCRANHKGFYKDLRQKKFYFHEKSWKMY